MEDHGDDYDPNMEEFVATNEWQQIKHGRNFVLFCQKFSETKIYCAMEITLCNRVLVVAEIFEIEVSVERVTSGNRCKL